MVSDFGTKTIYHHYIIILISVLLFSCGNEEKGGEQLSHKYTNELINETSPYLLQHAHNPVDWKPWNSKALEKAKKENKLIIISIGYAACHWCHVMEEESFKDDSIAKLMNDNFVSIKIDKEERPDINQIYINAVELMTGNSGWPLNCIALPDGRPVFGGTYFTKDQWAKALTGISDVYKDDPDKVIAYAEKLVEGIKKSDLIELNTEITPFKLDSIRDYIKRWNTYLDFEYGGQLTDTKFPLPNNLAFQLRYAFQNNNDSIKDFTETSLTKMAYGGIYDQIGGGFSRYTVDEKWHIPHFEKMLYDNAQLVSLYSEAYTLTKNPLYITVVNETLDFVKLELTDDSGAFYSSLDADSEVENGELEEGAYYRWTKEELQSLIKEDFDLFKDFYNINDYGKWENNNYILIRSSTVSETAKKANISIEVLENKIKTWKHTLLKAREKRNKPRLDDKVLTSWNAMMLKAYLDAYKAIGNEAYLDSAKKNAQFILEHQLRADGGLNHNYKNGTSNINGYLEDYAFVIESFIALYQATFEDVWLQKAQALNDYTLRHFEDSKTKMLYFTSDMDTDLIARKIEILDRAIPSSNSVMAHNLFKLGHYYADSDYSERAQQMLTNIIPTIDDSPSAYSNWLSLMHNYVSPYYEAVIVGDDALKKVKELNLQYLPNILIAGATKDSRMPLITNRYVKDETYIYLCVNGTCKLPTTSIEQTLKDIKQSY